MAEYVASKLTRMSWQRAKGELLACLESIDVEFNEDGMVKNDNGSDCAEDLFYAIIDEFERRFML